MLSFAENEFELSEVVEGATLKQHLIKIWKKGGKKSEQLCMECPASFQYLWSWFLKLNVTRQQGFSGVQRITYQEILAWSQLTGNMPDTSEMAVLELLDIIATRPKEEK